MVTKKDIQYGMMGKQFNDTFDGMLFMMDNDNHSFWMKNCIIPLDIIFISNNKVSKIHHNCPPCETDECERYEGTGDLVLELDGGTCNKYDITEGDRVYFD
jgi:uncharacterized membrane protein (UPF0127 family)